MALFDPKRFANVDYRRDLAGGVDYSVRCTEEVRPELPSISFETWLTIERDKFLSTYDDSR